MRTLITLALVAAALPAFADGNSSTATAQVGVKIVAPISIVNPGATQLCFGKVTVNDPTQQLVIAYPGDATAPTYTNGVAYPGVNPVSQAWFHVRKDHDIDWANVSIVVDPTVTLAPGVKVDTNKGATTGCYTYLGFPTPLSNTVVGVDMQHFYVGGTLTADANTFGSFTGTLNVVASYN